MVAFTGIILFFLHPIGQIKAFLLLLFTHWFRFNGTVIASRPLFYGQSGNQFSEKTARALKRDLMASHSLECNLNLCLPSTTK
jgi:hypothetical protein